MIIVQLNRQNFEYDVHSLVKAFYPEQDVHICYAEETECIKEGTENKRKAPEEEGKPSLTLVISFVSGESEDTGETKETERFERGYTDEIGKKMLYVSHYDSFTAFYGNNGVC